MTDKEERLLRVLSEAEDNGEAIEIAIRIISDYLEQLESSQ